MNKTGLLVFLALASAAFITVAQTLPPAPLPANAPATEFSAQRAFEHIRVIAGSPHPAGSPANAAVREYILSVLSSLGLEIETQQDGSLENVIARRAGSLSSAAVLLTAHLDSVAESPGATDDGSGVAVLLETARALSAGQPLWNSVIFLFTDNEESGTLGAQAFIAHHPWAQNVKVVIGFDAGGLSGPGILSATSADNGWLIRQLSIADTTLTGSSAINALADSGTDFGHAFKPAGFSGFAFDLYWDRRIHTPADKLENVNLSSLQHQGSHALLLARHFGNLDQLADPKEPDAVYFSVLRRFTVAYPSTWAVYLAVAVALLYSVLLAFGLRGRILTWRGMGYGMLVLLVGLMLAPLPALLLGGWITGVPIRYAARSLDQPREVAAVVFLALAFILLWFYWARRIRIASLPDLTVGALLPLMIGMLGISFAIPALSFALVWPGSLSLLACASWFYSYRHQKSSKIVIFISICSGAANIIILGPTILLGLFDQPTLTLLLFGALCGFLFPQIATLLGGTEKFLPTDRSHPGTAAG